MSDADLTPHQIQVLQRIADGQNKSMIAAAIGCSRKTVSHHVQNAAEKLDTKGYGHTDVLTVLEALRLGLIEHRPLARVADYAYPRLPERPGPPGRRW